ncbi:hypothetical protein SAMN04490186_2382 [Pseudomonas grimontii]|uniref:Uncharacterized protein n=1 Tax=Pseudomonas grimontii TaxID=129847 RepID=A0ABY0TIM1_9PSED|nr:hypothetical protein SAMN04490186_2382 [Pseudomonas grimontii]
MQEKSEGWSHLSSAKRFLWRAGLPHRIFRQGFAGVSTAQLWLSMQSAYDLWQAEHREQPLIERFARID